MQGNLILVSFQVYNMLSDSRVPDSKPAVSGSHSIVSEVSELSDFDSLGFPSIITSDNKHSPRLSQLSSLQPSSKVTIVSELPSVPVAFHIPIETLLDYDKAGRKVTLTCSKYSEIGNPHARKARLASELPAEKHWNRLSSYVSYDRKHHNSSRDQLNFMDREMCSIYNSAEKVRMDRQLSNGRGSQRRRSKRQTARRSRHGLLPPLATRRR